MRRSTTVVLRHRWVVLLVWIGLLVFGVYGASKVGALLSNQFSVPGSPPQTGLNLLHNRFHERSDGAFTLVAQARAGARLDLALARRSPRVRAVSWDGRWGVGVQAGGAVGVVRELGDHPTVPAEFTQSAGRVAVCAGVLCDAVDGARQQGVLGVAGSPAIRTR